MRQNTQPTFVITLRFSEHRKDAARHMEGHQQWIREGFERGVFLAVGSLAGNEGGCILAHNITRTKLQRLLKADPFVAHNIVTADILAFTPARTDKRLKFLTEQPA
jgi:uncharacterized protein YciI